MEVILFICSGSAACGPCVHAVGFNRLPVEIVRLDTREARAFLTMRSGLSITHVPSLVVVKPDGVASTFVGTQSVMKWLSSMFITPFGRDSQGSALFASPSAHGHESHSYESPSHQPGRPTFPSRGDAPGGLSTPLGSFGPGPQIEEIPSDEEPAPTKKHLTFEMAQDFKAKKKAKKPTSIGIGKGASSKRGSSKRVPPKRTSSKGKTSSRIGEGEEEGGEGESIALEIVGDEEGPEPPPRGYVDARTAKGMAIAPHPGRSNKDIKAMAAALQQERTAFLKSNHSRWGVREDVEA